MLKYCGRCGRDTYWNMVCGELACSCCGYWARWFTGEHYPADRPFANFR